MVGRDGLRGHDGLLGLIFDGFTGSAGWVATVGQARILDGRVEQEAAQGLVGGQASLGSPCCAGSRLRGKARVVGSELVAVVRRDSGGWSYAGSAGWSVVRAPC